MTADAAPSRSRGEPKNDAKPSSVVVKLDFPIKMSGSLVNQVTVRRPKVRDRMAMDESTSLLIQERTMICNLTELSPDELDDLDLGDYMKLQNTVTGFIMPQTKP